MSFKVTDIFRLINTKADLLKIMMFLENASLVLIKKLKKFRISFKYQANGEITC